MNVTATDYTASKTPTTPTDETCSQSSTAAGCEFFPEFPGLGDRISPAADATDLRTPNSVDPLWLSLTLKELCPKVSKPPNQQLCLINCTLPGTDATGLRTLNATNTSGLPFPPSGPVNSRNWDKDRPAPNVVESSDNLERGISHSSHHGVQSLNSENSSEVRQIIEDFFNKKDHCCKKNPLLKEKVSLVLEEVNSEGISNLSLLSIATALFGTEKDQEPKKPSVNSVLAVATTCTIDSNLRHGFMKMLRIFFDLIGIPAKNITQSTAALRIIANGRRNNKVVQFMNKAVNAFNNNRFNSPTDWEQFGKYLTIWGEFRLLKAYHQRSIPAIHEQEVLQNLLKTFYINSAEIKEIKEYLLIKLLNWQYHNTHVDAGYCREIIKIVSQINTEHHCSPSDSSDKIKMFLALIELSSSSVEITNILKSTNNLSTVTDITQTNLLIICLLFSPSLRLPFVNWLQQCQRRSPIIFSDFLSQLTERIKKNEFLIKPIENFNFNRHATADDETRVAELNKILNNTITCINSNEKTEGFSFCDYYNIQKPKLESPLEVRQIVEDFFVKQQDRPCQHFPLKSQHHLLKKRVHNALEGVNSEGISNSSLLSVATALFGTGIDENPKQPPRNSILAVATTYAVASNLRHGFMKMLRIFFDSIGIPAENVGQSTLALKTTAHAEKNSKVVQFMNKAVQDFNNNQFNNPADWEQFGKYLAIWGEFQLLKLDYKGYSPSVKEQEVLQSLLKDFYNNPTETEEIKEYFLIRLLNWQYGKFVNARFCEDIIKIVSKISTEHYCSSSGASDKFKMFLVLAELKLTDRKFLLKNIENLSTLSNFSQAKLLIMCLLFSPSLRLGFTKWLQRCQQCSPVLFQSFLDQLTKHIEKNKSFMEPIVNYDFNQPTIMTKTINANLPKIFNIKTSLNHDKQDCQQPFNINSLSQNPAIQLPQSDLNSFQETIETINADLLKIFNIIKTSLNHDKQDCQQPFNINSLNQNPAIQLPQSDLNSFQETHVVQTNPEKFNPPTKTNLPAQTRFGQSIMVSESPLDNNSDSGLSQSKQKEYLQQNSSSKENKRTLEQNTKDTFNGYFTLARESFKQNANSYQELLGQEIVLDFIEELFPYCYPQSSNSKRKRFNLTQTNFSSSEDGLSIIFLQTLKNQLDLTSNSSNEHQLLDSSGQLFENVVNELCALDSTPFNQEITRLLLLKSLKQIDINMRTEFAIWVRNFCKTNHFDNIVLYVNKIIGLNGKNLKFILPSLKIHTKKSFRSQSEKNPQAVDQFLMNFIETN